MGTVKNRGRRRAGVQARRATELHRRATSVCRRAFALGIIETLLRDSAGCRARLEPTRMIAAADRNS